MSKIDELIERIKSCGIRDGNELLEHCGNPMECELGIILLEARAELAEYQNMKPVAWMYDFMAVESPEEPICDWVDTHKPMFETTNLRPLYTHPQKEKTE